MHAKSLSLIAGTALSLLFAYVPGLNVRFARLSGTAKRLVMLLLLALSAAGIYGLSCAGWPVYAMSCDAAGARELIEVFLLAVIANQSIYSISPPAPKVREANNEA